MNRLVLKSLIFYIALLLLISCSVKNYIPEDKTLYRGAKLAISEKSDIEEQAKLEENINVSLYPMPNKKLAGLIYFNLWAYYTFDPIASKKIGKWLYDRFANLPVYTEDIDIDFMEKIIQKEMQDIGYFKSKVEGKPEQGKKFTSIIYQIDPGSRTIVSSIQRPSGKSEIDSLISKYRRLQIKEGNPYKMIEFEIERNNLASFIRSKGYFDFNAEDIFYLVDTSKVRENVEIIMKIKKPKSDSIYRKYYINKINVYTTSGASGSGAIQNAEKSYTYKGLNIYEDFDFIDRKTLSSNILISRDDLFSITDYNVTLNRLLNLNIFKYVNIQYEKNGTDSLDVNILLTPNLYKGVQYDLEASTSDRSFLGSSILLSFYNNNTFRRTEKLSFNLRGGTELQYVANTPRLAILNANLGVKYEIPRLIVPFKEPVFKSSVAPKTFLSVDEDFQLWLQYFTMNSTNVNFGYNWQTNNRINFIFEPLFFNLINVSRTTDEFEAQLKERPILKLNYQDIFLIGSKFSISYNSKKTERQRNHLFVSWNVETSGNSASLIAAWTSTNQQTPNISGVPISQYFKSDVELKLTRDFTTKMAWVSRFNIGFVKAYGQSEVAPFTKQFFIGGPSTLRGFEYRSVGPSRYKSIGENATLNPIDQAGDLRILINTEYRFPLFSFFRGAYFFDFGNVWLLQEDETRPDINLDWRKFYKEFAFNSGLGLRIDTDYVALRLDLGVPIYSPFEEEGNRWIYEQNLGRLFPWIRQNVVASLGIGYPF